MLNNFFSENRVVYGKTWKNIKEPDRTQMKIWRKRIPRWMPKRTNTLRIRDTYCFSSATMTVDTTPKSFVIRTAPV
jgi:hypothetical protein